MDLGRQSDAASPAGISLEPYDPLWVARFDAEAVALRAAFGAAALRIEHVGSTAVPGLIAKPVIDIQVSVASLASLDRYVSVMASCGYTHRPDPDPAFERSYPYFHKPPHWPHTFHVHLCEAGSDLELRHIVFRDRLRASAAARAEYAALKRELMRLHRGASHDERQRYADGKSDFVRRVLASEPDLAWRRARFDEYAADRRRARVPGYRLDVAADITRHDPEGDGDETLLWLARFTPENAERRIDEELRRAQDRGWSVEWKLHDHDEPPDLKARLEARGLRHHHVEALMLLDVAATAPRAFDATDVAVKEACADELDGIVALGEEVWDCRMPWLGRMLREMTDPERGTAKVYVARTPERVVGSGWIEFHGGSRFAQLCGGTMLEPFRGRGLYARLFETRLEEARRRGVPWIAVDAAPMSRPILERRGFRFVCHTYFMRTKPHDARPSPL